jgi:type I restriction enzyme, S subunit
MGEWSPTSLRDAGVTLIDCDHRTPPAAEQGYPYVTIPQMKEGRIDLSGVRKISPQNFAEWTRRARPQLHDVVLSRMCNPGETSFVPEGLDFALGQNLVLLRANGKKVYPPFLRWWVRSPNWWEQVGRFINVGAVFDSLKCADIPNFTLPLPPLCEQKAIATILSALDDKIELNRRMNATLEEMARALFQSWFVDFDPVRAKLDGRKPEGMDDATAALFPASLEDSTIGPVPRGWDVRRLPEIIEVNPQRTLKAGTIAPYLNMKNLPTEGHSAEEVIQRLFTSGAKFQNGDTLLARITPCLENGKTGYVDFLKDGEVGWGSTEFIVLAPKPPVPPLFGYLLARSDALRMHAIQNMTETSGRQRVPTECFGSFLFAAPPGAIARRFDDLTAPTMAKIKANCSESRILAALRDRLLLKLLSGEVMVRSDLSEAHNKSLRNA